MHTSIMNTAPRVVSVLAKTEPIPWFVPLIGWAVVGIVALKWLDANGLMKSVTDTEADPTTETVPTTTQPQQVSGEVVVVRVDPSEPPQIGDTAVGCPESIRGSVGLTSGPGGDLDYNDTANREWMAAQGCRFVRAIRVVDLPSGTAAGEATTATSTTQPRTSTGGGDNNEGGIMGGGWWLVIAVMCSAALAWFVRKGLQRATRRETFTKVVADPKAEPGNDPEHPHPTAAFPADAPWTAT